MMRSNKFMNFAKRCGSLIGWVPRIESGPGKGLKFDADHLPAAFMSGEYEVPVQNTISSLLRSGDVFYDIGANIGFFSVLACRLVGSPGAVYAFEPVPANASMVERNARLNHLDNIKVLKVALSCQTGKSELLLARYAGGAVLKNAGFPADLVGSIVVDAFSLDELFKRMELRPPSVMKIDVEGAELDVLRGMIKVLEEWSPAVIVELDDATQRKCEEKLEACRRFLLDLRYRVEILPNSYRDGNWFVRHIVAKRQSASMTNSKA